MKRKLSMLLSGFLVLILVGCGGSKKYEPNLAEMGMVNADEKYTNQYGVRDNLNIKGVTKKEDIIEVKKGKYLRVMPYKTKDGNFAEYEIK
ncbi:hypothetical protein [Clostridium paraputrificum]|uniref:hypothetical protein n=1 Tax=Clostridium paraputrificum TaxID=29363 RepID=UPI00189E5073|nr:hypothetical protein [Clostridium paraputrificum]